jgi:hypothetical protein
VDIENIDLSQYHLVPISEITEITSEKFEIFYDIEVEDNHSFFIKLDNGEYVLSHNCDGSHISGLYLGFFQRYAPILFKEKRIKKLRTPIITFNNNKNEVVKFFFKLDEYKEYLEKNGVPKGCTTKYYKGLGSWTKEKLQKLVKEYSIEYFIEDVEVDEISDKLLDDWIGDTFENCESRKVALREFQVNIEMA